MTCRNIFKYLYMYSPDREDTDLSCVLKTTTKTNTKILHKNEKQKKKNKKQKGKQNFIIYTQKPKKKKIFKKKINETD